MSSVWDAIQRRRSLENAESAKSDAISGGQDVTTDGAQRAPETGGATTPGLEPARPLSDAVALPAGPARCHVGECEACKLNASLVQVIENLRASRQEKAKLYDAAFGLWQLAHAPQEWPKERAAMLELIRNLRKTLIVRQRPEHKERDYVVEHVDAFLGTVAS